MASTTTGGNVQEPREEEHEGSPMSGESVWQNPIFQTFLWFFVGLIVGMCISMIVILILIWTGVLVWLPAATTGGSSETSSSVPTSFGVTDLMNPFKDAAIGGEQIGMETPKTRVSEFTRKLKQRQEELKQNTSKLNSLLANSKTSGVSHIGGIVEKLPTPKIPNRFTPDNKRARSLLEAKDSDPVPVIVDKPKTGPTETVAETPAKAPVVNKPKAVVNVTPSKPTGGHITPLPFSPKSTAGNTTPLPFPFAPKSTPKQSVKPQELGGTPQRGNRAKILSPTRAPVTTAELPESKPNNSTIDSAKSTPFKSPARRKAATVQLNTIE